MIKNLVKLGFSSVRSEQTEGESSGSFLEQSKLQKVRLNTDLLKQ
jgi:hypothetical protein